MGTTPSELAYLPARAHPRLKYATPLAITFASRLRMGTTEDIAVGGIGAHCDAPPPQGARITLLFNLPTGSSVRTEGDVRYASSSRFGVQFTALSVEAREALEQYTRQMLGYVRRGDRITKRIHITLRSVATEGAPEQLGETVVLSRNGGRLICRARFKIGEELRLSWPEKHRETQIRVVFRQLRGTADLIELGFEFCSEGNFWESELE